jgi:propanol-preferring alcohol dehydrogenase
VTVRAMIVRQPAPVADRPLRMEDIPDPAPGPGQILVEVRACGICRTDLHVVEGELPMLRAPLVPGHQVVGRVATRGSGATRFREGDRVGIAWLRRSCGGCLACAYDRENVCEGAEFSCWQADGG